MSSARRPLIALAVAAALGAAYWGWTAKLKPAREKRAAEAKKPFAGLQADATQEILLRKTGSPEVLLRKVDGVWRLVKPVAALADKAAVEGVVQALAGATREESIAEKGADLRQYGLDQPSGAVTFTPASPGAKAQVLFFGRDNPTGAYAYAMVDGQPEVFLTWLAVKNAVLKDADGLRDKTVWRFSPAAVRTLRSSQDGGFSLQRGKDGQWQVTQKGVAEPGRGGAIEEWLGELAGLKASKVPSEDGKGGSWGLAKGPHLYLELEGGIKLQLHAGAAVTKKGESGFYAQAAPGSPVFQMPDAALLILQKRPKELADRKAFKLEASQVQRIEIIRPGGKLSAAKSNGAWAWVPAQKPAGKDFDFDGFIGRFAGSELVQRLPKADKPAKPTATVFFYGASGAVLEGAEFGAKRPGGVVAFSSGQQATNLVAGNLLDGLPADLSATAKP